MGSQPSFYVSPRNGTFVGRVANDDEPPVLSLPKITSGSFHVEAPALQRPVAINALKNHSNNDYYEYMGRANNDYIFELINSVGVSNDTSKELAEVSEGALKELFIEAAKILDSGRSSLIQSVKGEAIELPESAPELYTFRVNRKENPLQFYERVWGSYRDAGILYRADLIKYDENLWYGMYSYCKRHKIDPATVLPPNVRRKTEAGIVQGAGRSVADDVSAALTLAMRRVGNRRPL